METGPSSLGFEVLHPRQHFQEIGRRLQEAGGPFRSIRQRVEPGRSFPEAPADMATDNLERSRGDRP